MIFNIDCFKCCSLAAAVLTIGNRLHAHAIATLRGSNTLSLDNPQNAINRVLKESQVGVFLINEIEYEHRTSVHGNRRELQQGVSHPSRTHNIELTDGTIYEVKNAQAGWADGFKSGKYSVQIPPDATLYSDGTIDVKGEKLDPIVMLESGNRSDNVLFDRTLLREDKASTSRASRSFSKDDRNSIQSTRSLQSGSRSVLVVRVILDDGQYNAADQTGLSNDVFGNGVDAFNLKSQYAACSANQLIFDKSSDRSMTYDPSDGTTAIKNGVVDIEVSLSVSAGDSTVRNAVTDKINTVFGVTSPNELANHVMYCLPSGTMGSIAYAYTNSWLSVYSNHWCNYLSTQMHEIGHNLGYAHSNEGGVPYADQTGMMGYSYSEDEGPIMCFNAAKSWQSQWYSSKSIVVDPSATAAGNCFEGSLFGISDYSSSPSSSVVLIKIDDSSSSDYFVTFNRQEGINSGTKEAGDLVTVVKAGAEGTSITPSDLLAKLSTGGSWSGSIDGKTMTVSVLNIDTSASPAYAMVRISENGVPCIIPDPRITSVPSSSPSSPPSISKNPTDTPTVSPTPPPSLYPTHQPTNHPTKKKPSRNQAPK